MASVLLVAEQFKVLHLVLQPRANEVHETLRTQTPTSPFHDVCGTAAASARPSNNTLVLLLKIELMILALNFVPFSQSLLRYGLKESIILPKFAIFLSAKL